MVNPKKDLSLCMARTRVSPCGEDKSWRVYLWKTHDDFIAQTCQEEPECRACHCPMPYRSLVGFDENDQVVCAEISSPPVLGELHFVSNDWNMETVSHECCHAMFHFLRTHGAFLESTEMEEEERYCYLLGDLVRNVYLWLYENDSEYVCSVHSIDE